MNKSQMIKMIQLTTDKLSDLELASLNIIVQTDQNPHNRLFDYETVKDLFTEDNDIRVHEEIKDALAFIVIQRLNLLNNE